MPRDGSRLRAARVRRRRSPSSAPGWLPPPSGCNALAAGARGHVGPAPGAAAPAAQRARGRCSLAPRARRASIASAPSERAATLEMLLAPSYPPGRRTGTSRSSSAGGGALPGRGGSERGGAGDLRHGLSCAGSAHEPLLAQLVAEHGLETPQRLDRARARLHRARPHERRRARSPWPESPRSGPIPAADTLAGAKYVSPRLPPSGSGDVVHAERTARLAPALGARCRSSSRRAARAGAAPLVAGRDRRPSWSASASRSTCALYHRVFAYQPGWVALPLGVLELGARGLADARSRRHRGAARHGGCASSPPAWLLAQVLGHAVFPLAATLVRGGRRRARTPRDRRGRIRLRRSLLAGAAASRTRPGHRP